MPWTFSHPAAVLPLRALCAERLSFAALVLGSMTPDLGYYLPVRERLEGAHTLVGLFTICLPAGLVLYLLLQWLSRPVVQLLPAPHRQALLTLLPLQRMNSLGSVRRVVVSVLIGAFTHLVWDSFTHADGWSVQRLPLLQQLVQINGSGVSVFKLLQHASTVVGACVLLASYARWLARVTPQPAVPSRNEDRWRYGVLAVVIGLSLMSGAWMAWLGTGQSATGFRPSAWLVSFVVESTTFLIVAMVLAALLLAKASRKPDLR